ncbi:MAG: peptidase inhibitor family I36 protein [Actinobacteria bacterium]|nr:peptidase inhibitor family I36 protein [Actinomycetota bacterium]MBU4207159.1 peptidase inhibitor family I36 protein [Actinomycetota bacterium]
MPENNPAARAIISVTAIAAMTLASSVLASPPAQAALSDCQNMDTYGCFWDGAGFKGAKWIIPPTYANRPCAYGDFSPFGWNDRISSVWNNTVHPQYFRTDRNQKGKTYTVPRQSAVSSFSSTYNNKFSSMELFCEPDV